MRLLLSLILAFSVMAEANAAQRNVAELAAMCAACHGTKGYSQGGTPSLSGNDKSCFIQQLQLFRNEKRDPEVMWPYAKGLTENEILLLADYFSKQPKTPLNASDIQGKSKLPVVHGECN